MLTHDGFVEFLTSTKRIRSGISTINGHEHEFVKRSISVDRFSGICEYACSPWLTPLWCQAFAAKKLGISRRTLNRKITEMNAAKAEGTDKL